MDVIDPRPQLRGAVYRGDAAAIVALLPGTEPAEWLQLGGDGLRIALDRHAVGAAETAGQWVSLLRDRSWDGDPELAEQLEARLGTGPTPMLRPLPVDLDELAGILDGDPVTGGGRLDLRTGEVWPQPAIDYAVEVGDEDEDSLEAPWWLPVASEGSRAGYRDMQDFIAAMPERSTATDSPSRSRAGARSAASRMCCPAGRASSSAGMRSPRNASEGGRGPGWPPQATASPTRRTGKRGDGNPDLTPRPLRPTRLPRLMAA